MASSDTKVCNLCFDDDGTSTVAVTWCTECEVFLCTDCGKHHKKSRLSQDHKTMSTTDYQKLPKFMLEISSQCSDHKKKFELYCSFHACPCCVTCITANHKKCQDMKALSEILKQVKSSASVHLLEKDLKDVKENLEKITNYLNSRIETSNFQKVKATDKIRSMRKLIDDYLNKIEKNILDDIASKQSKLQSKMNTLLQQLTQRANEISQLQSKFSKMKQYATELQMYVGLREIEKATSHSAKYIEDLKSGGQFDENNLEVTISSTLQSIPKDVKSFGDININTSPFPLQVKAGRKDQAQYLVSTIPRIEQIKPSILRQLTIPEDMKSIDISACRILPDGKYLILESHDDQSHLLLFSNDGIFMRKVVTFKESSFDTCFIGTNTVAVTLGLKKQTALADVDKNIIIKRIPLSHNCNAAASDGQILVICSKEKSTIVNLSDMSLTILEVGAGCIALFKRNIYVTMYTKNEVCCFQCTGEPLWTFPHHDIEDPGGLALDKNSFVYIASRGNNSIILVSPEGKSCKTILSEADGIMYPYGIDINRKTGIMIVSSEISIDSDDKSDKSYETAFVYKI